ncbi:hypothetical protein I6G82_02910 [Lysinibacillus macroides]|uniref:Uncharacterized protein n=1 Tax=Lysinibacillus macroides TaxID=33935 RepID=A0A0N0CV82_9BACI|nr:hypothetical protein [Lysinibacillus macroides]KOY81247.1 hypothetical protein ADM90_19075 [Lysinibacillus macroides]QPR68599.1 hypothetical protein I6G82_02910 [Lysinibacillus macroides]
MSKLFYTTHEVKEILGLGSLRTAQARVQALNEELKKQGYWTERGKIPIAFFHEKYPYIEKLNQE